MTGSITGFENPQGLSSAPAGWTAGASLLHLISFPVTLHISRGRGPLPSGFPPFFHPSFKAMGQTRRSPSPQHSKLNSMDIDVRQMNTRRVVSRADVKLQRDDSRKTHNNLIRLCNVHAL